MDKEMNDKARLLMNDARVMTLAVSDNDIPWSSPVYFVCHDNRFYFFSNENSRHINYAKNQKTVSASIFQDSDRIDLIFGFQMSGVLEKVSKKTLHLTVVRKYVSKFSFLKQIFGSQIIENKQFFLEKFKSHLYCFCPGDVFLSDNSQAKDQTTGKRRTIELNKIA
ncbi:MAG: hypothetical protein DRH93_00520 [Deltaproteobacteria bacterium]|nr:MAG: hypothetical protein DRH93_00520 [Deltaproteobacteria bacterium]